MTPRLSLDLRRHNSPDGIRLPWVLLLLAPALLVAACGGSGASSESTTLPPLYAKDSPEIRRIGEEAIAARKAHEAARSALVKAAPREYANYRQTGDGLREAMQTWLDSVQEQTDQRDQERDRVLSGEVDAHAMGTTAQETESVLAEEAPAEWLRFQTETALIEDPDAIAPAYQSMMALQRAAPAEFRAWVNASEQRKAKVSVIRGAHRMNRRLSAHMRAHDALTEAAPSEFAALIAAEKALETYKDVKVYLYSEAK